MTDAQGAAVVCERYWLTLQPDEIRVCNSYHGLSQYNRAGDTAPANPPQALLDLLLRWSAGTPNTERSIYLPVIAQ